MKPAPATLSLTVWLASLGATRPRYKTSACPVLPPLASRGVIDKPPSVVPSMVIISVALLVSPSESVIVYSKVSVRLLAGLQRVDPGIGVVDAVAFAAVCVEPIRLP